MRSALNIQSPKQRRDMISRLVWNGTRDAAVAEQRLRETGVSADEITWALKNPSQGMRP